jgi:hypothetical protein
MHRRNIFVDTDHNKDDGDEITKGEEIKKSFVAKDELVTNSLEYYDKLLEHNKLFFKDVDHVYFNNKENDVERNEIIFYDKKDNELFRAEYEILGVYHKEHNVWSWAWSNGAFYKNSTAISRKLLNHGFNIDATSVTQSYFLKTELITSRFRIHSKIQLEIHLAIATHLSKQKLIYEFKYVDPAKGQKKTDSDKKKSDIFYLFIMNVKYPKDNK